MPLYEYRCQTCDNLYERIERVSEPGTAVCPECGGEARRLLGAPALQFRGSGWYVNDYGKGSGNGSGATPAETEKAPASAESSTPPKPEKKKKTEKNSDAKVA